MSVTLDRSYRVGPVAGTVCVLGLGYVGLTFAVVLAEVGYQIVGVDCSDPVLEALKLGKPHFHEKGLDELLGRFQHRVTYQSALTVPCAGIYVISVGTPLTKPSMEPNLGYVRRAAVEVGRVLKAGDLVVLRSTVPVGTTRTVVAPVLEAESGLTAGDDFGLAFCPERTVEGKALKELRELPQIVGGFDEKSAEMAKALFGRYTSTIVDVGGMESAEMVKIMDNSYRDVMFAYANQLALLCEQLGLDMVSLVRAANLGYNRNNIPVPSPGVGGACLSKDPYILAEVCRQAGVDPTLFVLGRQINEHMPRHTFQRAEAALRSIGKSMAGAEVLVLGFAFKGKPETSDLRESPTLDLLECLRKADARITGYDPIVTPAQLRALGVEPVSLQAGFEQADAVIVMLNHAAFEDLDIVALLTRARAPIVLVDGWHMFDPDELATVPGVIYECIGR